MKNRPHILIILLFLPFMANSKNQWDDKKCIIRGACGPNPDNSIDPYGHYPNCLNCKLDQPEDPVGIDEETTELLYQTCPHLREQLGEWQNHTSDDYTEDSTGLNYWPKVCCTRRQVEIMAFSFGQARDLLSRCPVCYANWRKNFCATTCLSGDFLEVSRDENDEEMLYLSKTGPCMGNATGEYTDVDPGKNRYLYLIYIHVYR